MEASAADRRLSAIQGHLIPATDDLCLQIQKNPTAGEFYQGMVFLDRWLVLCIGFCWVSLILSENKVFLLRGGKGLLYWLLISFLRVDVCI